MPNPHKPVNIAQELADIEAKVDQDISLDKAQLSFFADLTKKLIIIEAKIDLILEALSPPEPGQAESLNLELGTPEDN